MAFYTPIIKVAAAGQPDRRSASSAPNPAAHTFGYASGSRRCRGCNNPARRNWRPHITVRPVIRKCSQPSMRTGQVRGVWGCVIWPVVFAARVWRAGLCRPAARLDDPGWSRQDRGRPYKGRHTSAWATTPRWGMFRKVMPLRKTRRPPTNYARRQEPPRIAQPA